MKLYQIDSFTKQAFKGNPAGVCISETALSGEFMQNLAMEMNLSETAFITQSGRNEFDLKWYTPQTEVDLCGHATLAAAHILYENKTVKEQDSVIFNTQSGVLRAFRKESAVELDFPAGVLTPVQPSEWMLKAFNFEPVEYFEGDTYTMLLFKHQDEIQNMIPNLSMLKNSGREVIVTAVSDKPEYDYINRFFAPCLGIDEDPVTGSAHCYLAPFWKKRLGKNSLTGFQASKRTGMISCRVEGDRVFLRGNAVTVMNFQLSNRNIRY